MKEIWKEIRGYENIYEVSTSGSVKTCKGKTTKTDMHGIRCWKERILKPREDKKNKSLSVALWKDGKVKNLLIHRLVAQTFIPNPNNLYTVNHKDGNRHNNNIENLEWMSLADNIRHGFDNNLYTAQKKIKIKNKKNNTEEVFNSMSKANIFIGKNHSYLSLNIKRGKFENEKYIWELM